jgi:hypothetical protein
LSLDRAVWTFATSLEEDQERAVNRLPKNAKDATIAHTKQRVLDQYLGIDTAKVKGRFKTPTLGR